MLICCGVTISIFCWIVRQGARVVLPCILIGALAQPATGQISSYDPAGNVTLILETSQDLGQWQESPWRLVLAVDKATMIGQSLTVYSNNVPVATVASLPPRTEDGTQLIDLAPYLQVATGAPSKFVRWRIPTHDLSGGIQPAGTIIVVTCGVAVLAIGGLAVYQMVKMCNRYLPTNNVGTNLNFRVLPVNTP